MSNQYFLIMKNILFLSILFLSFSCSNNKHSNAILPTAIGGADELMFVLNDSYLTDELSKEIKKTFVETYKILPQDQARFLVSSVEFSKLNSLLKRFINPIFIINKSEKSAIANLVRGILTVEEIEKIKTSKRTLIFKKNLWAKDQNITILVAENKNDIINAISHYKDEINAFYDKSNLIHYSKIAYIDGVNNSLKKQLKEYHNISLDIPSGYVLAENKKNFILLRKDEDKCTLFLSFDLNEYNAEIPINNLGIEKFNTLGHFLDGEQSDSYVIADTTLGFDMSETTKGNVTTFENAGLWVMENDFVGGGPFINNYIIDNNNNRVIYLSGMVYGPAEKNKKKYMRQFEAIFSSLKIY